MKINELILGSSSPYRAQLLTQAGLKNFKQVNPQVDESSIQGGNPIDIARERSELKASGIYTESKAIAITGDQVLEFSGKAYGKACSRSEAFERLREFSGGRHFLHSAYTLSLLEKDTPSKTLKSQVVSTKMWMRDLSDEEIEVYLDTGEWQGCAGCYQFENKGVHLFRKIEGDSSSIIGLPMPQILNDLSELGVNLLLAPQGPWHLVF